MNERGGGVEKMSGVIHLLSPCWKRVQGEKKGNGVLLFVVSVDVWVCGGGKEKATLACCVPPLFSGRFCTHAQGWQYVLTGLVEGECPAS